MINTPHQLQDHLLGGHLDGEASHLFIALVAQMIADARRHYGRGLSINEHAEIRSMALVEVMNFINAGLHQSGHVTRALAILGIDQ